MSRLLLSARETSAAVREEQREKHVLDPRQLSQGEWKCEEAAQTETDKAYHICTISLRSERRRMADGLEAAAAAAVDAAAPEAVANSKRPMSATFLWLVVSPASP